MFDFSIFQTTKYITHLKETTHWFFPLFLILQRNYFPIPLYRYLLILYILHQNIFVKYVYFKKMAFFLIPFQISRPVYSFYTTFQNLHSSQSIKQHHLFLMVSPMWMLAATVYAIFWLCLRVLVQIYIPFWKLNINYFWPSNFWRLSKTDITAECEIQSKPWPMDWKKSINPGTNW